MEYQIEYRISGKYSQELLDHAKQSATDTIETSSKRVIQKIAEVTHNLITNKVADAVAKSYNGRTTKV